MDMLYSRYAQNYTMLKLNGMEIVSFCDMISHTVVATE